MYVAVAILTFLAALIVNLVLDNRTILNKGTVNHWSHGAIKVASCMPSVYLFFRNLDNVVWWVAIGISLILVWSYFWVCFDGALNLIRKQHFFYAGSEDGPDDPKSDNFLQSIPIWLGAAIKIALCATTTFIYYKLTLN